MPESVDQDTRSSQHADTGVRIRENKGPVTERPRAESRRVRELLPPPQLTDRPRLPHVETDLIQPAPWRRWWSRLGRWQSSSCAVSFFFHFALLLVLGLLVQVSLPHSDIRGLIAYDHPPVPLDSAVDEYHAKAVLEEPHPFRAEVAALGSRHEVPEVARLERHPNLPSERHSQGSPNRPTGAASSPSTAFSRQPDEPTDWLLRSDTHVGRALRGRGRQRRALLATGEGGTPESERAVEWGLRWLMAHQRSNGSWNFDHQISACRGQCRNPGTEASTSAATAIALLPFLGAGYTHVEGEYREVVQRGVYYLVKRALLTPHGTDLREGTMYAQGLSAIALCEAYAMTRDPALKDLAQGAIRFIVHAQEPKGGGWRYMPGEPGDTTVTGWQLMGLKSGQMAGLEVPLPALYLAQRFLSSVESEGGARYGYLTPQPRNTTTAIGLLMRMYTGWRRNHPGLQKGVAYLSQWGPSEDNMYYNYYATQVMHHWGGSDWEAWNRKMRDYLVATQATTSHEAGSWYFSGGQGQVGGRLYNTAMAVMTLEVYYRYMPLYRDEAVAGEF